MWGGGPGTESHQMGVFVLICVSLGVLELKKFENHGVMEDVENQQTFTFEKKNLGILS